MPDYPSTRPPGRTRNPRNPGIAVPAVSRPPAPIGTRCSRCRGHILPGEPECVDCAIDRGERCGWLLGLGQAPAPKKKAKPPSPSRIPNALAERAVSLHRAGISTAIIADQLGESRQRVAQWIKHRTAR
jgi:hypothetical protein